MKYEEKTLSSDLIYDGRILHVRNDAVLLPNGHKSAREWIAHPGGVCVLALTDTDEVLLVRQFRYPYRKEVLELPAGKLEPGEDPLEAGKRELQEETGAAAERYVSLGEFYPSCGYTNEIIYLYMARGLRFGAQHPDEDEFLDVVRMPLAQAVERVLAGELPDGKTQTALLKARLLAGHA